MNRVVTRFAPSPTGLLHIGGARTALFNWLLARSSSGRFLLRIEDTDRVRSTDAATESITSGLAWLGLNWDGSVISQFSRRRRHAAAARTLLECGAAYRCFSSAADIEMARQASGSRNKGWVFESPWRDNKHAKLPDRPYAVRLRMPRQGRATVEDVVHGSVGWQYRSIGDFIILRSDGTPTYNFAVVIDDHDMGVTHVIRGDDHLANAAKQKVVYEACGWRSPTFAHVPLIHGADGRKLSKRHGAEGIEDFRRRGYPPEAIRNYLVRLGWSHGDEEFMDTRRLLTIFSMKGFRKSPARLDKKKLAFLSGRHLAVSDDRYLLEELQKYTQRYDNQALDRVPPCKLLEALNVLKRRSRTLGDIVDNIGFLENRNSVALDEKSTGVLATTPPELTAQVEQELSDSTWSRDQLEEALNSTAQKLDIGFASVARFLRAALVGKMNSPGVYDVMLLIGKQTTLARLSAARRSMPSD